MKRFNSLSLTHLVGIIASLSLATACGSTGSTAANYPSRTITYVIPYDPGGSTDPVGRQFAELLGKELNTDIEIVNRSGGSETIGITSVLSGKPDGYTLGMSTATGIIIQPLIQEDLTYHNQSDWTNISGLIEAPYTLFVKGDSPWETIDEFIAEAKQQPGQVTIGASGRMTTQGLMVATLEEQTSIDVKLVPYSGGSGDAIKAVLSGEADAAIATASAQLGLVEAGNLKALAYSGDDEYAPLASANSFTEAGYDMPYGSDFVSIAPPGLPPDIEKTLTEAALAVIESDEWQLWCEERGFIASDMGPDEMTSWVDEQSQATKEGISLLKDL